MRNITKRHEFLHKLYAQGHLRVVEPSDELKVAYLRKSESYLISARILLDNYRIEEAVSMTYYSMYYMVLALLYKTGIKCENHSGAIILLKKLYNLENNAIEEAKRERVDKQYYVDFSITREEVEDLLASAEEFNAGILEYTERMSRSDAGRLQKTFHELIQG